MCLATGGLRTRLYQYMPAVAIASITSVHTNQCLTPHAITTITNMSQSPVPEPLNLNANNFSAVRPSTITITSTTSATMCAGFLSLTVNKMQRHPVVTYSTSSGIGTTAMSSCGDTNCTSLQRLWITTWVSFVNPDPYIVTFVPGFPEDGLTMAIVGHTKCGASTHKA